MQLRLAEMPARSLARAPGTSPAARLSPAVAAALARFPRRRRKVLTALALAEPRLADLAVSFPAALFAIGTGPAVRVVEARHRVVAGAPLQQVAACLGLPLWLRRLPPEACTADVFRPLPDTADCVGRIVNLLPPAAAEVPDWLSAVSTGYRFMDAGFALWIAREARRYEASIRPDSVSILAAWAWYGAADRGAASAMITTQWSPALSLATAARAARDWIHALEFLIYEPPAALPVQPPADCAVGPYTFHEIGWGRPLAEEGTRLKNCLASFAHEYTGGSRVWSIRLAGQTVAALELEFEGTKRGMPRLGQLYAANNATAPDAVWAAAYQWLSRWRILDNETRFEAGRSRFRPGAWIEIWRPYRLAKSFAYAIPRPISPDIGPDIYSLTEPLNRLQGLRRR